MVKLFRSEDMQYLRLTFTQDASTAVVRALGQLSKLHLVDVGFAAQQAQGMADDEKAAESNMFFKKRIVACTNYERRLAFIEEQMRRNRVKTPDVDLLPTALQLSQVKDAVSDVKQYLESIEGDLSRNLEFKTQESRRLVELIERQQVLQLCQTGLHKEVVAPEEEIARGRQASFSGVQMDEFRSRRDSDDRKQPLLSMSDIEHGGGGDRDQGARFHAYMCGVIPVNQQIMFSRMLFRVTRGNTVCHFIDIEEPIEDPATGELMRKAVFIVAYVRGASGALERRIGKMCDFFRASVYDVPDAPQDFARELASVASQMDERRQVLARTQHEINSILESVAFDGEDSPLRFWQEALRQEKLVCDAMRKCYMPPNSNMVTAEGWVPTEDVELVRDEVQAAVRRSGAQEPVIQEIYVQSAPPTYFKTDKYTSTFQGIVETYGVPRFREANPGLFTIVTFPFLFGVMYGDIGHGTCLFLFGLWLVYNEDKFALQKKKKTLNEMIGMAFGGRYLLVMMGAFAVYCGTIYNDCFSIPTRVFPSHWDFIGNATMARHSGTVYPYGVDPGWYHTKNELTFFNSLKMKISVTLGVSQMTFGIVLSLMNHLYFNDWLSVWTEFVPQILFMLCTFGYMIFLIILKFCIDWSTHHNSPPNLIQTMIGMFLSPGSVASDKQLYAGQGPIQGLLVVIAVICIPWMLVTKPMILKRRIEAAERRRNDGIMRPRLDDDDDGDGDGHEHQDDHGHGDGEHHDFSEIVIHQAIHTIEFVLGCVSNTASYLRLWALSLAHAELSNVFWEKMIMEYGANTGSPIMMVVGFGAWAGATFAVLLCMDVLECFLHALRLHWVEFQNKFFQADGYKFEAFTFEPVEED